MISDKLISHAKSKAANLKVTEVRLGLGYTCVELSNKNLGLAWTPLGLDLNTTCTHVKAAGSIAGSNAVEILEWLSSERSVERALGLSVFNAVNVSNVEKTEYSENEAISLLNIEPKDHVVMVGYFGPIVPKIKEIGCKFEVVELKSEKPDVISPEEGKRALKECDVAIITSTSIINGTCDELLSSLGSPRAAVMLGPSTPMCPEVFADSPITQLSGSLPVNIERIKQIISEGGGTRLLKKHLKFVSVKC